MKILFFTTLFITLLAIPMPSAATPIQIKEYKLKNGLTVWLNEDHSQPNVVGSVVVKIGAKDSPNTGIAHYFEHIMFKGTDRIGTIDYAAEKPLLDQIAEEYSKLSSTKDEARRLEIQKEINRLSIAAAQYAIPNDFNQLITKYGGSRLNAGTHYDYTSYHNSFMPQYLEHWCELNSERLISPVFRLFQSELETVYEEKNMYNDRLGNDQMQVLFERFAAPHPYQYPIIGSTENLKNPNLAEMRAFFEQYYVANNMGLILTGDFDANVAMPIIERTFGRIRSGKVERPVPALPKGFQGAEKFTVKFPIPFISATLMAWHIVPTTHPDKEALDLIVSLFSNSSTTGLLDQITTDGKVMQAEASIMTQQDMGAFLLFAVPNIPFGSRAKAQALLKEAVQRVCNGDFSEEKFERLKLGLLRSRLLNLEKLQDRMEVMKWVFAYGLTWADYEASLQRIATLTKNEVVQVARKYLNGNYLDVRKKTGRYPKDKISKPPFAPIIPPNRGKESEFARYLSTLPVNNAEIHPIDLQRDARQYLIRGNQLVHLFMTENSVNDIFSVEIVFRKGYRDDPALYYLPEYLSLVGTEKRSVREINDAFEALGTTVSWSEVQPHEMSVTLRGYDKQLVRSLQLFGEFLSQVATDESKMKKLVDLKKLDNKALKKSADALSSRLFLHVRYGQEAEQYLQPNLKQVKQFTARQMHSLALSLLQIEADYHYVGKLPTLEVEQAIYNAMRTDQVQTLGTEPRTRLSKHHQRTTIYIVDDPKVNQAVIQAYMVLPNLSDQSRKPAELYTTYLGRGMSSLLFQEVREYRSLAYGVSSWLETTHPIDTAQQGVLGLYMSTQADKTADAIALLNELVTRTPNDPQRYTGAQQTLTNSAYSLYPSLRWRSRYIDTSLRRGYKLDPIARYLEVAREVSHDEMMLFHSREIAAHPLVFTIVGNKSRIDLAKLRSLGNVIELKPREFVNY